MTRVAPCPHVLLGCTVASLAAVSPGQIQFTATSLGFPPGESTSTAHRINNRGDILVRGSTRWFLYTPVVSQYVPLSAPATWGGNGNFFARNLNDLGQVVGEAWIGNGNGLALFTPGQGWTDLGRLDPSLAPAGSADAINNPGVVVGAARSSTPLLIEAFRWQASTGIQSLSPGVDGWLKDINDLGQGFGRYNNQWHYWNGSFQPLSFYPQAIGAAGLVAGNSNDGTERLVHFRFGGAGPQFFNTPAAPSAFYTVHAVNEAGLTAGRWEAHPTPSSFQQGAFLFHPSVGYVQGSQLDALVPGWVVDAVFDVNERGQMVGKAHPIGFPGLASAVRFDPVGTTFASGVTFGTGCYSRARTFYELFTNSGGFDLGGTATTTRSLVLTPSAGGYLVTNGTGNSWYTPSSPNLAQPLYISFLTPTLTLPFAFPFPGGSTTAVKMAGDGYVWLNGTSTTADGIPTITKLVTQPPRLCPLWCTMSYGYPSLGRMHFDITGGGTEAVFSWIGVPRAGIPTGGDSVCDVQCVIRANGSVEYRWRRATTFWSLSNYDVLVGFSPGNGAPAAPMSDLSSAVPFATGPEIDPLRLLPTSLPLLGQTAQLSIENSPTTPSLGLVVLGLTALPSALELSAIGMPGCRLYTSIDVMTSLAITGPVTSHGVPLPASAALAGVPVFAQAAVLAPGVNPMSMLASNAVRWNVDWN